MYIGTSRTYYADGAQHATRAPFLILAADDKQTLYALVRRVALGQLGQFMMGSARIGDMRVTLSGTFGGDGLPIDYDELSPRARSFFQIVPADLAARYWSGSGEECFADLKAFGQKIGKARLAAPGW